MAAPSPYSTSMGSVRAGGSTAALRVANQRRVIEALRTGGSDTSVTQR